MHVTVGAGRLEGEEMEGVVRFLGVPYASPPLGSDRWRGPAPVPPWTGVRAATALRPAPPQADDAVVLPGLGAGRRDEDCLYLNVWAPRDAAAAPVMVWFPGGAFLTGGAGVPLYDGARLASRERVVVVTVTYRVGAIGFAAVPGTTPNRGLLDQVAALAWVRDNIEAFGGDPGNVTAFGESAGGGSVLHLLTMPAARGLFRRAIVQSGATDLTLDAAQAGRVAEVFLAEVGDLHAPVAHVVDAQQRTLLGVFAEVGMMPFHPWVDGDVVACRPIHQDTEVDLLIGTTRDEMRLYLDPRSAELDRDRLLRRVGRYLESRRAETDAAASLVALYDGPPADAWSAIQTDGEMRRPAAAIAGAHRGRTFAYRFDEPLVGRLADLRACHASDLPYTFGTFAAGWTDVVGSGAERLSEFMQRAWAGFARSGEPGWPVYDLERRTTMLLGDSPRAVDDPDADRRRLWAELAPMTGS